MPQAPLLRIAVACPVAFLGCMGADPGTVAISHGVTDLFGLAELGLALLHDPIACLEHQVVAAIVGGVLGSCRHRQDRHRHRSHGRHHDHRAHGYLL
jgi:hypothetical protein